MNKGTIEGTEAEIDFVKYMNKYKNNESWNIIKNDFGILDNNSYYCVRVTNHVISKLNNKKVLPKSDAYIIKANIPEKFLEENDFLIDENIYDIQPDQVIKGTGISIKRPDSNKFQIIKMVPDSFYRLFGNYYLGAAASLYCNISELCKNDSVLKGWKSSWQELEKNLPRELNLLNYRNLDLENQAFICNNIKKYANTEIKNIVLNNKNLSDIIFKGKHIYDEPYVAEYLFVNNLLEENKAFDFCVTTGSGRSKGDYTIVLKPKN